VKIEFQQPAVYGGGFVAKKGTVIDAATRPPDQVQRWLKRGLVKVVDGESASPRRQATTGGNRRKAVDE
jgi:hypothetical protein